MRAACSGSLFLIVMCADFARQIRVGCEVGVNLGLRLREERDQSFGELRQLVTHDHPPFGTALVAVGSTPRSVDVRVPYAFTDADSP